MNVPVGVALLVKVTVGVLVRVGVEVAVAVKDEVGVAVAVAEGPAVGDEADVVVGVGLADGEAVGDASTVGLAGPGVCVEDGVSVGGSVLVIGAVGGSLKHATGESAIQSSGAARFHLARTRRRVRLPAGGCPRLIAKG